MLLNITEIFCTIAQQILAKKYSSRPVVLEKLEILVFLLEWNHES